MEHRKEKFRAEHTTARLKDMTSHAEYLVSQHEQRMRHVEGLRTALIAQRTSTRSMKALFLYNERRLEEKENVVVELQGHRRSNESSIQEIKGALACARSEQDVLQVNVKALKDEFAA